MNIHDGVRIIPWQETWEERFAAEKERIMAVIGNRAEVIHVGSTSIKGMWSKPIIDILICPVSDESPETLIPALESIGYRNLGECDRPGRWFLSYGSEPNKTFYVHLCDKSHQVAQDQLLFQRIEQKNPEVAQKYAQMKMMLAIEFCENKYLYRQIKGLFIEGVLSTYRGMG